jgi:hypothetical protein
VVVAVAEGRQVVQILTLLLRAVLVAVELEVLMLVRQGTLHLHLLPKAILVVLVGIVAQVAVVVRMLQLELELLVLGNPAARAVQVQRLLLLALQPLMLVEAVVVREVMGLLGPEGLVAGVLEMLVLLFQQILRAKPIPVVAVVAAVLQPTQ